MSESDIPSPPQIHDEAPLITIPIHTASVEPLTDSHSHSSDTPDSDSQPETLPHITSTTPPQPSHPQHYIPNHDDEDEDDEDEDDEDEDEDDEHNLNLKDEMSSSSSTSLSRSSYVKISRSACASASSSSNTNINANATNNTLNDDKNNKKKMEISTPDASIPLTNSQQTASWLRIYSLSMANFGINCAWALEFAITTPYFEKGLKAGKVISHAVWLVGPLSGLIVAPIVGALSDRCRSRFGRRRPFIFIGMLTTIIGMAIFSNATSIADFLTFDSNPNVSRILAIVIAILSFCILDLAINTTMWPVRALQGDLIPNHQQHSIQSASIVMFSLGDLAASALLGLFPEPVTRIQIIFIIAALIYSTTVASLLIIGKEKPLIRPSDHDEHDALTDNITTSENPPEGISFNIFAYLRSLPGWMWRIGITHALGFFALFCFLPNTSSWLGSTVLGGDPDAKHGSQAAMLYEKGVSIYGAASLPRTIIQIIYSAVYPYLLYYVSPGQLMGFSFGVFGVMLLIFSGTRVQLLAQAVVVVMALPIAAHFTLPVGLTVENSDASNRGRFLGALNCFAVIPQLIDTSYTGFVSRQLGEATVMRIGAVWSMFTAIFALLYMRI